jgi:hypothetical protein
MIARIDIARSSSFDLPPTECSIGLFRLRWTILRHVPTSIVPP